MCSISQKDRLRQFSVLEVVADTEPVVTCQFQMTLNNTKTVPRVNDAKVIAKIHMAAPPGQKQPS
jgi:hypothetical protein